MKKFLLFVWNKLFDFAIKIKSDILIIRDKIYRKNHTPPNVMSIDETIDYIIENNCSVARYGDGEIKLASGTDISFQVAIPKLSQGLREILKIKDKNFLPCIVDCFGENENMTDSATLHWKKHMSMYRKSWYSLTDSGILYGNSFISRPYMQYRDKSNAASTFKKLKQIWSGRKVVIVEGEKSRLGVGNDLFDNTAEIRRILIPNENAFANYDDILAKCLSVANVGALFLLAAGPTATVLAYDLCKSGCQAVDIGHIDIEYEWLKCGATEKQPVKNKFVNEARDESTVGECVDNGYLEQIIRF